MQLVDSPLCASSSESKTIPEVPFVTGVFNFLMAFPIMGPPFNILRVSSGIPPTASNKSAIGVPIFTQKLEGFSSFFPVTVTTLSIKGLSYCTAW